MFAIIAVMLLSGAVRAQTAPPAPKSPPPTYPALAPVPIRLDHNAMAITLVCLDATTKLGAKTTCADYAFCRNPFDLTAHVPTLDELAQLGNGVCPSSEKTTVAQRNSAVTKFTASVKSIASLGSSWQGDVLAGLASFLVARAKAELVASFVFQLKADLCIPEVKPVLLATCGLLANADPYAVPVSWNALKTAFATDLRTLPEALINTLSTDDKAEPLRALVQVIELISQGAEPLDTVVGLRIKYATIASKAACDKTPYACALLALGSAVEILAPSPVANAPSLDRDALELRLKIAARLLKDAGSPIGLVTDIVDQVDRYRAVLQDLISRLLTVRTAAKLSQEASTQVAPESPRAERVAATQLAFDNYARCVSNAFAIAPMAAMIPALQQATPVADFETVIDHLGLALEHARAGDYVAAFVEVQASLAAANLPSPPWFTKYGGFLADVAAAKTPADAQAAIEAAAAPVGSWRRKRGGGRHTLWINGYLGGQIGAERLFGAGAPGGFAFHGGLFAPVGLEADLGFHKTWSVGVLASAIDLGALVDLRTSSSSATATVNNNANVGARQVFSPGAYLVFGLGFGDGGIPITFGAGASVSPELRSVDLAGGTTRDVNAIRFNAFLAVDVAIFGL